MRIKWLYRIALLWIYTTQFASAGEKVPVEPSDKVIVYNQAKMPEVSWLFAHMEAEGYQVPADGDTFAFKDYLDPVKDNSPKVNDFCFYTDTDRKEAFGIVRELGDNLNIVVVSPIGNGLIEIQSVDLTQVRGFLRPSKPVKEHGKGEHI
jgi:hypothetical protein